MPEKSFYKINAAVNASTAEILIYAPIGASWWDETVSAKQFIADINALDVTEMTVRINSLGGSVVDGIAIYNAIKRHKAAVTTVNDGIAASIASLILMAGDTVEMAENAQIMIHAPWTFADGNAAELRKVADMLDSWAEAMSTSYANKSGKTKDDILALLTDGDDHWYTADDALAEGFIDQITGGLAIAASLDRDQLCAQLKEFYAVKAAPKPTVAAATLTQEIKMPNRVETQAAVTTTPAAQQDAAQIAAQALAQDQSRRNDIAQAFSKFSATPGVQDLMALCQNDIACTTQVANDRLLAKLGEASAPVAGSYAVVLEDEHDKFRTGVTNALMARVGLVKADTANNYRGYTLSEIARASLEKSGIKTGSMDKMAMVAAAFTHSTSDFTNLLANVANKALLKGFEEAEETFQLFTSDGVLTDFKPTKRVGVNDFPSLDKVAEGAEYKYGTFGDRGETIVLATYGKLFSITRQAIINDDLDSFTKVPKNMGRASIRTVGDLVYAVLTGTHLMSDSKTLFHADHANIGTAGVISTASVDAMRVLMGKQKIGGGALNIRLANLIVPLALEGTAKVVRDSENSVGGTAATNNQTVPNSVRGTFDVISDARLDAVSSTAWYGAANGAVNDTIEVAYLDGNKTPTLEQQNGWGVDGVEFKVRLDAGVKALAWQGLAKNAGA
ncbi:MAG: Clp protease ClpP [Hydrogenophaga sp.]|nr:Clp protease ClpP [Hydrogenophaga sp.]